MDEFSARRRVDVPTASALAAVTTSAATLPAEVAEPTGIDDLDAALPGGGWPGEGLIELLSERAGGGGLLLLLPLLRRASRCAWVAPPHTPYAPGLAAAGVDPARQLWVRAANAAEALWASEQLLASGGCRLVLCWPAAADYRQLRRLQLACRRGGARGVLFRPAAAAARPSPARLRLTLRREPSGLRIELYKAGGVLPARSRRAASITLTRRAVAGAAFR